MILAGDIGGTQTTLALFAATRRRPPGFDRDAAIVESYASRDFAAFGDILRDFLARHRPRLVAGCIGIAGPVRGNRCTATNLPWTVEAPSSRLSSASASSALINDLEAVGYGIDVLEPQEILELQAGAPPGAAGQPRGDRRRHRPRRGRTLLGRRVWRPFATEGGHADFAPKDELEIALLRFLQREHERVSWERVLSGPGLVDIYRFLLAHAGRRRSAEPPGAGRGDASRRAGRGDREVRRERQERRSACGRWSSSSGSTAPRPGTSRSR